MSSCLTVALGGNPNIGKSTLFNTLTGQCQHVGNWPGKTVERTKGYLTYKGQKIKLVDLPGIYGLNTSSPEELIARNFILYEKPDVVLAMVDATNLERNLYLAMQFMELTPRLVLAVNMMDMAQKQGLEINTSRLSTALGVPVVPIVAATGQGTDLLLETIVQVGNGILYSNPHVNYGTQIENYICGLSDMLDIAGINEWPRRWLAVKLLENNKDVVEKLRSRGCREILQQAAVYRNLVGSRYQSKITGALYCLSQRVTQEAVTRINNHRVDITGRLDNIILHRLAAFPVMLALLGIIFTITIFGASPLTELLENLFNWLAVGVKNILDYLKAPFWIAGPLVDGLIVGVGTVVSVMLPTMAIFFILFALLEDSGFVPRLAFIMDRPMKTVGSQGKHCISCLLAFGCSIPAVVSTRIMSGSHRLLAILTSSILPCNGRLGVMLAITGVFFGPWAPLVMVALIVIAAGVMMLSTFLLHITFLRHESPGFVLELPPYRLPCLRGLIMRTLRKQVLHVMVRATLIAAPMTVLIWLFSNLPAGIQTSTTITEQLAAWLNPVGLILGLDGRALVAILYALPAKEIVLGALAVTSSLASNLGGSAVLGDYLLDHWTALKAFTFLVFFMLYLPCTYTTVVTFKETGSLKWTLTGMLVHLSMALITTWVVYRTGLLIGI